MMINKRFDKFIVLSISSKRSSTGHVYYECLCDCGKTKLVRGASLKYNTYHSCGCNIGTHNRTKTKTYKSYRNMIQRCEYSSDINYHNYGGRGIIVCPRWRESFENFLEDMGERPSGRTLDRIDVDGNYEKSNCRWATNSEQANNKRKNRH